MKAQPFLALLTTLEVLFSDKTLRSVTYFTDEPKKKRLKITRRAKSKGEFSVTIGKPCYAERQFIQSHKGDDLRGKTWAHYKAQ